MKRDRLPFYPTGIDHLGVIGWIALVVVWLFAGVVVLAFGVLLISTVTGSYVLERTPRQELVPCEDPIDWGALQYGLCIAVDAKGRLLDNLVCSADLTEVQGGHQCVEHAP